MHAFVRIPSRGLIHGTWAILSLCFFSNVLIAQSSIASEPLKVRVGLQTMLIPSPGPDLPETGADYRVLAEPLAPASNRLIAAFLLPEELKAMMTAKTSLTRYALVEVPRQAEFAEVSPAIFKQVSDGMGDQFGAKLDATIEDQQKEIDLKLKALGNQSKVTIEKPAMLRTLFSKTDAIGYGAVMPTSIDGKTITVAMCTTVLRVRQRLLFLYTYARYTDEESVKSLGRISEQWSGAILKANSE